MSVFARTLPSPSFRAPSEQEKKNRAGGSSGAREIALSQSSGRAASLPRAKGKGGGPVRKTSTNRANGLASGESGYVMIRCEANRGSAQ